MTQGELDDLRKLCDDAHVGPWKACQFHFPQAITCGEQFVVGSDNKAVCKMKWSGHPTAEFIARSRTAIPELLDEIDRLKERLEEE